MTALLTKMNVVTLKELKKKHPDVIYHLINKNRLPLNPVRLNLEKFEKNERGRQPKIWDSKFIANTHKSIATDLHFSNSTNTIMCLTCASFGR